MKKLLLSLILLLLAVSTVFGMTRDVSIEPRLSLGDITDDGVIVRNEDKKSGVTDDLEVRIVILTDNKTLSNTTKSINSYSYSKTTPELNTTNHSQICGFITPLNYEDPIPKNDGFCIPEETSETSKGTNEESNNDTDTSPPPPEKCGVQLDVDKVVVQPGDKLRYAFKNFAEPVRYVIRNRFGEQISVERTTETFSTKTFTTGEDEQVFILEYQENDCSSNHAVFTTELSAPTPYLDILSVHTNEDGVHLEVAGRKTRESEAETLEIRVRGESSDTYTKRSIQADAFHHDVFIPSTGIGSGENVVSVEMFGYTDKQMFYYEEQLSPTITGLHTRHTTYVPELPVYVHHSSKTPVQVAVHGAKSHLVTAQPVSEKILVPINPETALIGVELRVEGDVVDTALLPINLTHEYQANDTPSCNDSMQNNSFEANAPTSSDSAVLATKSQEEGRTRTPYVVLTGVIGGAAAIFLVAKPN